MVVFELEVVFPGYVSCLCVLGFDFWWWSRVIRMLSLGRRTGTS
jgi:hypothetical protein